MPRRLKTYVHLDGRAYGPGDEVPADVAARIGAHAWEDADTAPAPAAPAVPASTVGGAQAPPRSGRGSGAEGWRTFAASRGVDVEADASRDEVIDACEQAGVIEREE